ncbi:unnamed protein product, partial [Ectocarpus sp. 12 AP-2014]
CSSHVSLPSEIISAGCSPVRKDRCSVVIHLELSWETTACIRLTSPLSWFPPRSRFICEGSGAGGTAHRSIKAGERQIVPSRSASRTFYAPQLNAVALRTFSHHE